MSPFRIESGAFLLTPDQDAFALTCKPYCPPSICPHCLCDASIIAAELEFGSAFCNEQDCQALDGTYLCSRLDACRWEYHVPDLPVGPQCPPDLSRVRIWFLEDDDGNTALHLQTSFNGVRGCNFRRVIGPHPATINCQTFNNYELPPTTIFDSPVDGPICLAVSCHLTTIAA